MGFFPLLLEVFQFLTHVTTQVHMQFDSTNLLAAKHDVFLRVFLITAVMLISSTKFLQNLVCLSFH